MLQRDAERICSRPWSLVGAGPGQSVRLSTPWKQGGRKPLILLSTVPALAVYHLTTLPGLDAVTSTRWLWNGREKRQIDHPEPQAASPAPRDTSTPAPPPAPGTVSPTDTPAPPADFFPSEP